MKKLMLTTAVICTCSLTTHAAQKLDKYTMETWLAYHKSYAEEHDKTFDKAQKVDLFKKMNADNNDILTKEEVSGYWKKEKQKKKKQK